MFQSLPPTFIDDYSFRILIIHQINQRNDDEHGHGFHVMDPSQAHVVQPQEQNMTKGAKNLYNPTDDAHSQGNEASFFAQFVICV